LLLVALLGLGDVIGRQRRRQGDRLAARKPAEHVDEPPVVHADVHRVRHGAAVLHQVDGRSAVQPRHALDGHVHRVAVLVDEDLDAAAHAVPQGGVGAVDRDVRVVELQVRVEPAALLVRQRRDPRDLAGEHLARHRVDRHSRRMPDPDLAEVRLQDLRVDVERARRWQVDDLSPLVDDHALLDRRLVVVPFLGHARGVQDHPVDRREDLGLGDFLLGVFQLGALRLEQRLLRLQLRLRLGHAGGHLSAGALDGHLGLLDRALERRQRPRVSVRLEQIQVRFRQVDGELRLLHRQLVLLKRGLGDVLLLEQRVRPVQRLLRPRQLLLRDRDLRLGLLEQLGVLAGRVLREVGLGERVGEDGGVDVGLALAFGDLQVLLREDQRRLGALHADLQCDQLLGAGRHVQLDEQVALLHLRALVDDVDDGGRVVQLVLEHDLLARADRAGFGDADHQRPARDPDGGHAPRRLGPARPGGHARDDDYDERDEDDAPHEPPGARRGARFRWRDNLRGRFDVHRLPTPVR
jgi:hypothetical protein